VLSFKYRVYPSKKQVLRLNRQMYLSKEIYNILLEKCKEHYKQTGKTFSQFDMNKYISQIKQEKPEFKELHSQVLQNISKRIADSYKAFFRRVKTKKKGAKIKVGFPRVKKYVSSLTYPQAGFKFKNERRLHLSNIGSIPIVLHRLPKGEAKTCFIKQYPSGKWYVGFSCELPKEDFKSNGKEKVGIDVGLTSFATLSNGQKIEPPKFLRKSEDRLKLLQRRISRKKKGSKNKRKAKFRFAKLEEKVSNQRLDFLHKLSRQQVNSYGLIAIEKLDIQDMRKTRYLAKSISDASWGIYAQMLHYKAPSAGCEVFDEDPVDTTKKCNKCGALRDMPLSERIYNCPVCGHIEDRDINAAKNILVKAMVGLTKSHACGDSSSIHSTKNEQDVSLKQELYGART